MEKKPLVDLHVHLDGSIRLATMLDIAREEGISLPAADVKGLRAALRCGEIRGNIVEYLSHFEHTLAVMQSYFAIKRVCEELMEDLAADGVKYAEVRFMPKLHMRRNARGMAMSGDHVMGAVIDGLHYGGKRHGVDWGIIVCSMRHVDPAVTGEMIDLAIRYKDHGVVAVDLAGDDNLPAFDHGPHFRRAWEAGLGVTIHAAEAGPPERIHEAIEVFNASRIGHGVHMILDTHTLYLLDTYGVTIEACLTSNVQTGAVPSYYAHPAQTYLELGLRVTLNTDNRMLADTTSTREFEKAAEHWPHFSPAVHDQLVLNAIRGSFASEEMKETLAHELLGLPA